MTWRVRRPTWTTCAPRRRSNHKRGSIDSGSKHTNTFRRLEAKVTTAEGAAQQLQAVVTSRRMDDERESRNEAIFGGVLLTVALCVVAFNLWVYYS